jgi:hypothetical protein
VDVVVRGLNFLPPAVNDHQAAHRIGTPSNGESICFPLYGLMTGDDWRWGVGGQAVNELNQKIDHNQRGPESIGKEEPSPLSF